MLQAMEVLMFDIRFPYHNSLARLEFNLPLNEAAGQYLFDKVEHYAPGVRGTSAASEASEPTWDTGSVFSHYLYYLPK